MGMPEAFGLSFASIFPHKKNPNDESLGFAFSCGTVLLSHRISPAVPSALECLTSVFGMGTGGSTPLWAPQTLISFFTRVYFCLFAFEMLHSVMQVVE